MFTSWANTSASMADMEEPSFTTSTTTTTTITTNTTTTITSGFNLYVRPVASPWINSTGLVSISSLPVTMTVNSIVTPVMTYGQLNSTMDKWNAEQQDQERHFLYHINQINTWNRTLIENTEEIAYLHNEVEKVKLDQQRLEQELDYVLSQQKELEHLLTPFEEFVKEQSGPFNLLYINKEYERIHKLAEIIDTELKRMSQDVQDIIAHLHTLGNPEEPSELIWQLCRILNTHLSALQWITQNSGIMQKKVEEVTKVFEDYRRKEQECNIKTDFD